MLKKALLDCAINEKCCSVDGGRGICPLFSSPPRGIWQLKSPHPREFAIQGQKHANARGQPRGGGGALGAAGIDWWIIKIIQFSLNMGTMFFDIIVIPHDQLWAYYYFSTIWMTVKRNTWRH